ncbi:MAG: hypothetical protein M1457_08025 [bacterium]|nr:hypothetical protein [bacterium]
MCGRPGPAEIRPGRQPEAGKRILDAIAIVKASRPHRVYAMDGAGIGV